MAKGKFEAGGQRYAYPASQKPSRNYGKKRKVWPIVVAAVSALIVAAGAAFVLLDPLKVIQPKPTVQAEESRIADGVFAAGVDLSGMSREEALAALDAVAPTYSNDFRMTLQQTPDEETDETPEPIVLEFPSTETGVIMDSQRAVDEAFRVGREIAKPAAGEQYVVPYDRFLSISTSEIRATVNAVSKELGAGKTAVDDSFSTPTERREVEVEQEDGTTVTETQDVQLLRIKKGRSCVDFREEDLFNAVMNAYAAGEMDTTFTYTRTLPKPVDIDALVAALCKDSVDAYYDTETHEIVPEVEGFGFDREELETMLEEAAEGQEIELTLHAMIPEVTTQTLEETLFSDVLAEVFTKHTANWNRTHNLELACAAINGTVLQPGDRFSFNETVGQRTEAKGYLPATVYVAGGNTAEETGGGVCQVASSIYYATLQADLKTIERSEHMFAVTYVPLGMDAAIYWGVQDFKFENDTGYPLRIEAEVGGGNVHIKLVGTDARDYTVELYTDTLSTNPFEEVYVETDEYAPGEVITTGYTGYRVTTYMIKRDKTTGEKISETKIDDSSYMRRDRQIAIAPTQVPETLPPETTVPPYDWPTDPTETPTYPYTSEPTTPPEEPTEPEIPTFEWPIP